MDNENNITQKWMLSHPMNGYETADILEFRKRIMEAVTEDAHDKGMDITFVDNFHHDIPDDSHRLEFLGESIKKMKDVDVVVFCGDWYNSKGCWVELEVCKQYGIKYTFLD